MSNNNESHLTRSERMGQFRLKIIGGLLASPPVQGDLKQQLSLLAQKPWLHPVSGEMLYYSIPTLERWYYKAKKEKNSLLKTLSNQQREDKGCFKSITLAVCEALKKQYHEHASWSTQLHLDNLRVHIEQEKLQPSPPVML